MKFLSFSIAFLLVSFALQIKAQTIEGTASIVAGDYTLQGIGDVLSPELGNQFHYVGGEVFTSKNDKLFFGASVHDWSRFNGSVLSATGLVKYRVANDSYQMELFAGPAIQHRVTTALGGTIGGKMTIFACQRDRSASIGARIEVGNRGIFADMYFGMRFDRFGYRIGTASFIGGDYFQLEYFSSDYFSFGVTYTWDPAMNQLLSEAGYSDYNRRALGLQATIRF